MAHCSMTISVPGPNGAVTDWVIETGSPNINIRHGWSRFSLKNGDQVQAVIYPIRTGGPNGALVQVTLPGGKVLQGASGFIGHEQDTDQ